MLTLREIDRANGASGVQEKWDQSREQSVVRARLNEPLPKIADPMTRVRVLEPFRLGAPQCVPARPLEIGDEVDLPRSLAADLVAIGKAERI